MSDLRDVHPVAPATGQVLYQVVHPSDMTLDRWTQDYREALATCVEFVQRYGAAHLHAMSLHAGTYNGECLFRADIRTAA